MTRLDIINAMLRASGQDIVTSADSNNPDAQVANDALDKIIKRVLMKGWWFNQNWNVTLAPDNAGKILLPSNTLRVRCYSPYGYLVKRGKYLFDPVNTTSFNIGASVVASITVSMPIEDMPESAADYISAYAVYRFYVDDDGDADKARDYQAEASRTFVTFNAEHMRMMAFNAKNSPRAMEMLIGIRPSYKYGARSQPQYPGGRPSRMF